MKKCCLVMFLFLSPVATFAKDGGAITSAVTGSAKAKIEVAEHD